ncbi:hypothetical protein [Neorhizobium alkalisoli]|uniref:hypothetical protein n=1 Tax=Neorhizobium alkalisoli TaxID=528178 RepID=UPI000CF8EB29|nr:hypothetical protein [Neorhizobium alkalisoli]
MRNEVSVFPREQNWVVRLVEQGAESEREFRYEVYARSWAEGQRIRLNKAFSAGADIANRASAQAEGCFAKLED